MHQLTKHLKKIVPLVLLFGFVATLFIASPATALAAPTSTSSFSSSYGTDIDINFGTCDDFEITCWARVFFYGITIRGLLAIATLFATLLSWGASALYYMVQTGTTILTLPLITTGFRITLSLVNFLFIIAIIVSAFATIFRYAKYNIKETLKKVIIAALLVNFSFLIAGLFIDFSNALTYSFIDDLHPDKIGARLNPQSLLQVSDPEDFGVVSSGDGGVNQSGLQIIPPGSINSDAQVGNNRTTYVFHINEDDRGDTVIAKLVNALIMIVIFTFLMMITILGLAMMLLVRNIWLAVLLVFMPLVWGLWVLPPTSKYFGQWWGKFTEWIIYLPTVTFFVFLATTTMRIMAVEGGLFGKDFALNAIQILILCGFLMAALKLGKKAGVVGTGLGLGAAVWVGSKIKKSGIKLTGASLKTVGKHPLGTATVVGTLATGGLASVGIFAGGIASKWGLRKAGVRGPSGEALARGSSRVASNVLSKKGVRAIPGAKKAAAKLSQYADRNQDVDDYIKDNLKNMPRQQKVNNYVKHLPMDDIGKVAVLRDAVKEGYFDELAKNRENLDAVVAATKRLNPQDRPQDVKDLKELVRRLPQFAKQITGQTTEEILGKIKDGQLKDIHDSIFDLDAHQGEDRNVLVKTLTNLNKSQWLGMSKGSANREEKARRTILRLLSDENVAIQGVSSNLRSLAREIEQSSKELYEAEKSKSSASKQKTARLIQNLKTLTDKAFIHVARVDTKTITDPASKQILESAQKIDSVIGSASFQDNPKSDSDSKNPDEGKK